MSRQSSLLKFMTPHRSNGTSSHTSQTNSNPRSAPPKKKSNLTPEQKARCERNRLAALERRRQRQLERMAQRNSPNGSQTSPVRHTSSSSSSSTTTAQHFFTQSSSNSTQTPVATSHVNGSSSNTAMNGSHHSSTQPMRRARKRKINYSEEDSEDDSPILPPPSKRRRRISRRQIGDDDDEEYQPTAMEINMDQNEEKYEFNPALRDEEDDVIMTSSRKKKKQKPSQALQSFSMNSSFSHPNPNPSPSNTNTNTLDNDIDLSRVNLNADDSGLDLFHLNNVDRIPREEGVISQRNNEVRLRNRGEEPGMTFNAHAKNEVRACNWYTNPQDRHGRRPGDPEYNPKTLRVPSTAFKNMTDAHKQYWKMRSQFNDGIIFFKIGKFYELFHDDAEIGHKELGLEFMGNESILHVGFPESSFNKYAEQLAKRGYKVYRVEQTETPQQKDERVKKSGKKSKVVQRDICQVVTRGTIVETDILGGDDNNYLLSIAEQPRRSETGQCLFAIAFADITTHEFRIGHFEDDRNRTRLRTLLVQIRPSEIIYPKHGLSPEALEVLRTDTRDAVKVDLHESDQFNGDRARALLRNTHYFASEEERPDLLQSEKVWKEELPMMAIGNLVGYLKSTLLDEEILPHSEWLVYSPVEETHNEVMMLDGSTLTNLEILENEDGGIQGTLLDFVNKCQTPFGKREMKEWLKTPLTNIEKINERLAMVEFLMQEDSRPWISEVRPMLQLLPDLKRLLSRISALGTKNRKMDEAVMFDDAWKAKKVKTFCQVLDSLRYGFEIIKHFQANHNTINVDRLKDMTSIPTHFADFEKTLEEFGQKFDKESAQNDGCIRPSEGINERYDQNAHDTAETIEELNTILRDIQRVFGDRSIKWYQGKGKDNKYLIEIPIRLYNKLDAVPEDWSGKSTKTVIRISTAESRNLVNKLQTLEDDMEMILRDSAREIFALFAQESKTWRSVVKVISELDCLLALAHVSANAPFDMIRPKFVDIKDAPNHEPYLKLVEARHPCISIAGTSAIPGMSSQFIPNDTFLGCGENLAKFVMVTGPNMGGKSTLLRQTCICVILAHIGCFVPARECELTPVDRIFTRVGANDRILSGQSTFMVELEETANILRHSTRNSLVILDELGRGTSTFDGTAIAYSVARHLFDEVQCRCLFSTHYHGLCDSFMDNPRVGMYHMSFQKMNETITFLYKFTPGVCKESHGINCARLAGLHESVLRSAEAQANVLHERIHASSVEPSDCTEDEVLGGFEDMMNLLLTDAAIPPLSVDDEKEDTQMTDKCPEASHEAVNSVLS